MAVLLAQFHHQIFFLWVFVNVHLFKTWGLICWFAFPDAWVIDGWYLLTIYLNYLFVKLKALLEFHFWGIFHFRLNLLNPIVGIFHWLQIMFSDFVLFIYGSSNLIVVLNLLTFWELLIWTCLRPDIRLLIHCGYFRLMIFSLIFGMRTCWSFTR